MSCLTLNEDQAIWLGLIGSLMIHGLLFVFSGTTFIQQAQYSVQPSVQTVEVSIEETKYSRDVLQKGDKVIKITPKINIAKKASRSISGVKVKANPDYFQNSPPEYPELAKQMRQEGLVMLAADVDREGMPVKVEIIQSSGHRLLDQAALKAVSHWKFQPGRVGDIPVESSVTVPIRFRLEK
jgi:periplasmic protein TonB